MESRDSVLLSLRPELPNVKNLPDTSLEEQFQNETLRPIIKLQRDILLAAFRLYIENHKNTFYDLTLEKKMEYIENALQKDMKFRNSLKGIILGQFTTEEFEVYSPHASAFNKRMMDIIIERLKSNMQLLEFKYA